MKDYEIELGKEKRRVKTLKNRVTQFSLLDLSKDIFNSSKRTFVNRLFWGRGNLYRQFLHLLFIILTTLIIFTGISSSLIEESDRNILASDLSNPGDIDILEQGSDITMVLVDNSNVNFEIITYTILEDDTLDSISEKFGISTDAIKSSNLESIDYFSEDVTAGDTILIPEIEGVFVTVSKGETIQDLMDKITSGNIIDIIEINRLDGGEEHIFTADGKIFVPDGTIVPPERPKTIPYSSGSYAFVPAPPPGPPPTETLNALNGVQFFNPLSHPSCAGYGWSRGFSSWHNGVDLPRPGGCETRAAAAGTVTFSGWEPYGGGYALTIDHGNGVQTLYFHHTALYVRTGQTVYAGQEIGYMGSTGNSTGTHLHLGLRVNYVYYDPSPYIPY
ncbi:MAG: M23 family metallopeptidase [Candidatus Dojkabacteria bacterium]|nr:M23 family metallopeptidase [Candidatus Dojkabacteria bacterium]MDQ7021749.1 M23 family metallopeptidase [Candidatus Dojkabacteria bacterium]